MYEKMWEYIDVQDCKQMFKEWGILLGEHAR